MKKMLFMLGFIITTHNVFAGAPIFSLMPTVRAPSFVLPGQTAVAYYQVSNNTPLNLQNIGVVRLSNGVEQIYTDSSGLSPQGFTTCRHRFNLEPYGTCILKLQISADQMIGPILSGPMVCQNADSAYPIYCSSPNSPSNTLHIVARSDRDAPSLNISPTHFAMSQGALFDVTVTNLSPTITANNVTAHFGSNALTNKVEVFDFNQACLSLAPGASCTLQLISYVTDAIASTPLTIRGANTRDKAATASVTPAIPSASYQNLFEDVLIDADIWAEEPKIMSAEFNFEGIEGVNGTEQDVIYAGGAWNIVTTPDAPYGAYTSSITPDNAAYSFGYPTYYSDAFPVCFSWPVLPSTVHVTNFELLLNSGKTVVPEVVSLVPNEYYNQRSCVVLFGKFGNRIPPGEVGSVYPLTVTIVNRGHELQLVGLGQQIVSAVGLTKTCGNSYRTNAGPYLTAAKLRRESTAGQFGPAGFNADFPNGGIALYGADAQYRLRVYTTEGFSTNGVSSLLPTDYGTFFRVKVVAEGKTTYLYNVNIPYKIPGYGTIEVVGLASLGKAGTPLNDAYISRTNNYIDIILKGNEAAVQKITQVDIPTTGINPATHLPYQRIYNSGGPGNNPTPGIFYSSPGPIVEIPVTMALDDPLTVTYP